MKQIWKYALELQDTNHIDMPIGAQVLTVQMQDDTATIWALVDPSQLPETHVITLIGTGQSFNTDAVGRYVGTFQYDTLFSTLVLHVFDRCMANRIAQEA